jgi:lipopolysaccharide biosynthesis glycosyltransferase
MSTHHANARFFLPRLQRGGLALFTDGDVLFRGDVEEVFAAADPSKAVMCVQHRDYDSGGEKKGGHVQQPYARKNWSSFMLWNLDHPAHARLTDDILNGTPGRDLHRFCWLRDDEIGELPLDWNWLVGVSPKIEQPAMVHFTLGLPSIPGHEQDAYAEEWRGARARMQAVLEGRDLAQEAA